MVGINRPKGINIKSIKELGLIRESGHMLKQVKQIINSKLNSEKNIFPVYFVFHGFSNVW